MSKRQPQSALQQPQQPAVPLVVFRKGKVFNETWDRHKSNLAVQKALNEFITFKKANPLQPFGSKDRRFMAGALSEYIHAGLTYDISIIYKISGRNPTVITLHAVTTHDESGTAPGSGANHKKQAQLAKRMDGDRFE